MVKVAFIVEGKCEQIFIDFLFKNNWFSDRNIQKVGPTIDAKGGGNLCPRNMGLFVSQAKTHNPDKIFILTDLECEPCVEKTKERLGNCNECTIVLAKKALESWFLADNEIVKFLTNSNLNSYEFPENTSKMPYDELKEILLKHTQRGTGSKVMFARRVLQNGFDIERAAAHPNCLSAKYFIDKITTIGVA